MAWSVMKAGRGGVLFLFLASLLFSAPTRAAVFRPETFTLANGLRVVIVHDALAEAFVQMLWIKAGAVDDPFGQSGLAHYLEHMMFKGTENLAAGVFSSEIAAHGGQDNAFTQPDATAYHVTISPDFLALSFQMEAERLGRLSLDPAQALTERDVILSERRERSQNDPIGAFYERFNAAFWGTFSYGRPVIGTREDIETFTAEKARAFYKRYYTPQNAVLVVVGKVKTSDVLRLAAGTFGRLAPGSARESLALPPPPPLAAKGPLVVRDVRVRQPFFVRRILVPSLREERTRAAALEVLAEVLASGQTGQLYRRFVLEEGKAVAIDVGYDSMPRGAASFSVVATPVPGGDTHALAREVDAYLHVLARRGVSERDVAGAKRRLLDSAVFARDSLAAPAQILGGALAAGFSVDDVEKWPERIARVTAEQVSAALRALVAEKRTLTGVLEGEGRP